MERDQDVPKEANVVHTQKMNVRPLLAESLRITYIRLPNHLGHEDVVRAGGCEGVGEIPRRGQHWGQEYGRKSAGTQGRSRGCHTFMVLRETYSNSVPEDSHLHKSTRHTHQSG